MITDLIEEIYVSMSRNKLRIALTGFSIAWGIFLLIVLLGAGNGLLHGMMSNFSSQSVNKIQLWPGYTSLEKDGLPKWRNIYLDAKDVEYLHGVFPREIAAVQPSVSVGTQLAVGDNHSSVSLQGVYPEAIAMNGNTITYGRGLNEMDIRDRRKVIVLHQKTAEKLFLDASQAVGQWVKAYDIEYRVVGVYKGKNVAREEQPYVPLTTATSIYKPDGHYSKVTLLVQNLETAEANEDFNKALKEVMSHHKQYDPNDPSALWLWNSYEDYLQTQTALNGIQFLIWIIGIATLIAGVTGISNIMLITVRERTHEFGIRKAIGARPMEIVRLVIFESIAITMVFGYVGLFFGIGLTELVGMILSLADNGSEEGSFTVFMDPTVDLNIVIAATVVMVIAGVIAGYVPAKRAVSIKPIEALTAS
ncbi:MAG: ABC transporter permease [Bacteroidales bacterium]|nr:ABC transporter permease [Candidatus Liminaster caballi]